MRGKGRQGLYANKKTTSSIGQQLEARAVDDTSEVEPPSLFAQKRMQTWWRSRNISMLLTTIGVPNERFFSVYF